MMIKVRGFGSDDVYGMLDPHSRVLLLHMLLNDVSRRVDLHNDDHEGSLCAVPRAPPAGLK
jgi:hypothetical protein